jgi:hypothetical protein
MVLRYDQANSRIVGVLVRDIVIFISWFFDNLAIVEGASWIDSIDSASFVICHIVRVSNRMNSTATYFYTRTYMTPPIPYA